MHFSRFLTLGALSAAPISAALTAEDVVQDIQDVADASAALTQTVEQLTLVDYSFLVPVRHQSLQMPSSINRVSANHRQLRIHYHIPRISSQRPWPEQHWRL